MSTAQYYMVTPQGKVTKTDAGTVKNVTEFLKDSVGGWFELVGMENEQNNDTMDMWVNEWGVSRKLPRNIPAEFLYLQFTGKPWYWPLYGNAVFALSNEDGETVPLTERYIGWLDSVLETHFIDYTVNRDTQKSGGE